MWDVFLYSIKTNKMKYVPHPLFIDRAPPSYARKSAFEEPAIHVNAGKATYTFTSVFISDRQLGNNIPDLKSNLRTPQS